MQSRGCHLVQSQDIPHNLIGWLFLSPVLSVFKKTETSRSEQILLWLLLSLINLLLFLRGSFVIYLFCMRDDQSFNAKITIKLILSDTNWIYIFLQNLFEFNGKKKLQFI